MGMNKTKCVDLTQHLALSETFIKDGFYCHC